MRKVSQPKTPTHLQDGAILQGGTNTIILKNNRVYRAVHTWSLAVHKLLDVYQEAGLEFVPRSFGIENGFDVYSYLEGEVGDEEYLPSITKVTRTDFAQKLRQMHDASVELLDEDLPWQFPAQEPVEVICHGDPAPYNCVFEGGRFAGIFDFDCAKKGPRALDLAQVLYRFFPLSDGELSNAQIGEMREMIADYGGDEALFEASIRMIPWWIGEMIAWLEREAERNPLVQKSLERGDRELYVTHKEHYEALAELLFS